MNSFEDFAQRFTLRGSNVFAIRRFFTDEVVLFLESTPFYHIESNGKGGISIMDKERQASISEIKAMIDFATRLEDIATLI
ncbi:MAG: hypothetical protein ABI844_08360 [Saprospiraceae bacterium]